MIRLAQGVVLVSGVYLAVGLLFALVYVVFLGARLDPILKTGGWGVRLILLPAAAGLWPLLLARLIGRRAA
jgi:hypothetical protein